jgi:hypothetical protein
MFISVQRKAGCDERSGNGNWGATNQDTKGKAIGECVLEK